MNNFDKLYLFFFTLLSCFTCRGQESENNYLDSKTYFVTGTGGSFVNIIDEGISPLLYKGEGANVVLGHFQDKQKSLNASSAKFDFNNTTNTISGAEMYTFRLEGHFQHYWKFTRHKETNWKVRPGVDLYAKWALRQHRSFTNNSQHIETRFSVAPSLMIARPLKLLNRNFELGMFSSIPIFTYATRPLFASTRFVASINKEEVDFIDYVKNGDIVSLASYFKWNMQPYLYYSLKNGNGLRIDYNWSYENYKAVNPIRTGEHSITISSFFAL